VRYLLIFVGAFIGFLVVVGLLIGLIAALTWIGATFGTFWAAAIGGALVFAAVATVIFID
jgi:hypothetical protein